MIDPNALPVPPREFVAVIVKWNVPVVGREICAFHLDQSRRARCPVRIPMARR